MLGAQNLPSKGSFQDYLILDTECYHLPSRTLSKEGGRVLIIRLLRTYRQIESRLSVGSS